MRSLMVTVLVLASALPPWTTRAQDAPPDPERLGVLAADDEAQLSLGGFRLYLERIRPLDAALHAELDPPLAALEERDLAADVVFGVATGLGVATAAAAIPVFTELEQGEDLAIGLVIAGASTFVLGIIIQAIVRPGHGDLLALIDRHDELVGRR